MCIYIYVGKRVFLEENETALVKTDPENHISN